MWFKGPVPEQSWWTNDSESMYLRSWSSFWMYFTAEYPLIELGKLFFEVVFELVDSINYRIFNVPIDPVHRNILPKIKLNSHLLTNVNLQRKLFWREAGTFKENHTLNLQNNSRRPLERTPKILKTGTVFPLCLRDDFWMQRCQWTDGALWVIWTEMETHRVGLSLNWERRLKFHAFIRLNLGTELFFILCSLSKYFFLTLNLTWENLQLI